MINNPEAFASLRLTGERFHGSRLPVDTLNEIIRYRNLIAAAAKVSWEEEHPHEALPEALQTGHDIFIEEIMSGSSVPVLGIPLDDPETDTYVSARDDVNQLVANVSKGLVKPDDFPRWADIPDFWDLGRSLEPEEQFIIQNPVGGGEAIATIDRPIRDKHFYSLRNNLGAKHRTYEFRAFQGRVFELNAQETKFKATMSSGVDIHGRYRQESGLAGALKSAIGTKLDAPTMHLFAQVSLVGDRIDRVNELVGVLPDRSPWHPKFDRLNEIGNLLAGWSEGDGRTITRIAARNAAAILTQAQQRDFLIPAIFPNEDGGINIQWHRTGHGTVIECLPDGSLEISRVSANPSESQELSQSSTEGIGELISQWDEVAG